MGGFWSIDGWYTKSILFRWIGVRTIIRFYDKTYLIKSEVPTGIIRERIRNTWFLSRNVKSILLNNSEYSDCIDYYDD
jgi:hypothetical protein